MAEKVSAIQHWLATLRPDQEVGIDDGGLCLRVVDDPFPYYEIGGLPDPEAIEDYECPTCADGTMRSQCTGLDPEEN